MEGEAQVSLIVDRCLCLPGSSSLRKRRMMLETHLKAYFELVSNSFLEVNDAPNASKKGKIRRARSVGRTPRQGAPAGSAP